MVKAAVIEEGKVDAAFVKSLRGKLQVDQETFAHLLGMKGRTVSRWENEDVSPDVLSVERIVRLKEVADLLLAFKQPASAVNWLRRPQQELEGVPPIDLLGSEYATKVLKKLIQQAAEGTYS